jgi:hypothetical protein
MRISVLGSFLLLLLIGMLPSLSMDFFDASSLAFGLSLSLMLLLIFYLNQLIIFRAVPIPFLVFLFLITLHSTFLSVQQPYFDVRAYMSFFVLFFVFSMSFFLSKIILSDKFNINPSFEYIFVSLAILSVTAYMTDFGLGNFFYGNHKSIFPFQEPSHFALFFGPFFLLYLFRVTTDFKRILLILGISLFAIIIESATLLIYSFLAIFLFLRAGLTGIIFVVPILVFGAYFILNDPYFLSRAILSSQSDNLTALVYLQGLTDAYNALVQTNGWGLGFQMLGTQPPSGINDRIQAVLSQGPDGAGLNRKDGGFVAAKLTAEFGVLGLTLLLAYIFLLFKVFIRLRKIIRRPRAHAPAYTFALVFIYASSVEVFVRGMGYFSPSLFLFFTALFVFNFYKKRVKCFASDYC